MAGIPFPNFDPIAVQLGPIAIHWYALAYLAGFVLGWKYMLRLVRLHQLPFTKEQIDDFLTWAVVGVILGGRVGYILFYQSHYYVQNPLAALAIWQGGMSFHGGLLGIIGAILLYSRKLKRSPFELGDLVAAVGPIGLFLGRVANFVNGELFGRPTTLPWGVVFPQAPDQLPRHPSQLYEAALEGLVLFVILMLAVRLGALKRPGILCGLFLSGYGVARFVVEFAREPDVQLGYLWGGATMGQLLCIPMVIVGIVFIVRARKRA